MTSRILIVEDDEDIASLVSLHLRELDYRVDIASDGPSGLRRALAEPVDLVILDLSLPGLDGLEICRQIRAGSSYTPILMLTARDSEVDRVLGLETGADDYLAKPFSVLELTARVKALLRRVEAMSISKTSGQGDTIETAQLRIDPARRSVEIDNTEVTLTAKEFDLLHYFAQNPGRVFTRSQLLDTVWGYGHEGYEHTVNSHINRLRSKIESDPSHPHYILTVWGVGYRFFDPERDGT